MAFPYAFRDNLRSSFQRANSFLVSRFQTIQTSVSGAAAKLSSLLPSKDQMVDLSSQESQSRGFMSGSQPLLRANRVEQIDPWKKDSSWVDEPPNIEVTVPKGSLCELNCTFKVGLPPDAVFDIITDPENKRVFRNIQRVASRKVLKDDGSRQLVELEQEALWRFLWLTGIFTMKLLVDQDRCTHTMKYTLCKEGFMKRFEGSWMMDPLYIDSTHTSHSSNGIGGHSGRVASLVKLQQIVQPAMVPPPPFSWYLRKITAITTETMIQDLQDERKRIFEGRPEECDHLKKEKPGTEHMVTMIQTLSKMKQKPCRKTSWSNKKLSRWDVGRTARSFPFS